MAYTFGDYSSLNCGKLRIEIRNIFFSLFSSVCPFTPFLNPWPNSKFNSFQTLNWIEWMIQKWIWIAIFREFLAKIHKFKFTQKVNYKALRFTLKKEDSQKEFIRLAQRDLRTIKLFLKGSLKFLVHLKRPRVDQHTSQLPVKLRRSFFFFI